MEMLITKLFNRTIDESAIDSKDSLSLIVRRGNQLHEVILVLVAIYGLLFSIINFIYEDKLQGLINISLVPSAVIAYLLFKNGNRIASKVWNLTHVSIVLSLHSLIRSPQSLILAFFFPVIISTLIVFQGERRRLGYYLTALILSLLIVLLTTDYRIGNHQITDLYTLKREWLMNVGGAIIVTVLEVIFILKINIIIQNELLLKSSNLAEINESLNSTIKTREKLISILSHDFRGPVITINAGLEMLYDDEIQSNEIISPHKQKIYIELLKKTKSTIHLMDDLLLWSRSQTNQINCKTERNSMQSLANTIKNFGDLLNGGKNIKYELNIPKDGEVIADKRLLEGILMNLMSNASKFSEFDGLIEVNAIKIADNWKFSIVDHGIGISEDILERINSGENYTTNGTSNERGHGLGLQLVKEFLSKHDAKLEIESKIGVGTTMSFQLPAG
jgi:signal transduction histidine kinase